MRKYLLYFITFGLLFWLVGIPEAPPTIESDDLIIHSPQDPYTCQTDADCSLQLYDFCCIREWRTYRGCFAKGYESLKNLSCETSDTCMQTGQPIGCTCVENTCRGIYDRNRKLFMNASLG